jgi:hypothetical protein
VAEMYEGSSAVANRKHLIDTRRKELLDQYAAAIQDKDLRRRGAILKDMQEFSQRNPQEAITSQSIQRMIRTRMTRAQTMEGGIVVPVKQRGLREEGAFANL